MTGPCMSRRFALIGAAAVAPAFSNVQPITSGLDARAAMPQVRDGAYRRSKGKQARPKKRSNRLIISKRVRLKHRRARR
jgi:hypothetical protein